MKPVRLVILSIAILAALFAGFLAVQLSTPQTVSTAPIIQKEPVVNILAASENVAVGSKLTERSFQWVKWPKESVLAGFILQQDRPDAFKELRGAVVRLPMFAGEAIRPEKIADASSGVLSSPLPAGKRALSVDITASSSAGGLILPNDRVDVMAVRNPSGTQVSEVVLSNIRVLAIDQETDVGTDTEKSVIGSTVTLEVTLDQARILTTAKSTSQQLTLGLRSVADASELDTVAPAHLLGTKTNPSFVQIIKSGSIQSDEAESADPKINSAVSGLTSLIPLAR